MHIRIVYDHAVVQYLHSMPDVIRDGHLARRQIGIKIDRIHARSECALSHDYHCTQLRIATGRGRRRATLLKVLGTRGSSSV